jgi:hypothetical protein
MAGPELRSSRHQGCHQPTSCDESIGHLPGHHLARQAWYFISGRGRHMNTMNDTVINDTAISDQHHLRMAPDMAPIKQAYAAGSGAQAGTQW